MKLEINKEQQSKLLINFKVLAEQFLKDNFDIPLIVPIKLNGRLSTTLGFFEYTNRNGRKIPKAIELSKKMIMFHDMDEVLDTLNHELIHYALCYKESPFDDSDIEFINTCNRLGVGLTRTTKHKGITHIYTCKCGKSQRKETRKYKKIYYHCGSCLHDLRFDKTIIVK